MTKMICTCKEFSENMSKLNDSTMFAFLHGHQLETGFVYFRYCPWCSKKLFDDDINAWSGSGEDKQGEPNY
jgi:hypothetical protein